VAVAGGLASGGGGGTDGEGGRRGPMGKAGALVGRGEEGDWGGGGLAQVGCVAPRPHQPAWCISGAPILMETRMMRRPCKQDGFSLLFFCCFDFFCVFWLVFSLFLRFQILFGFWILFKFENCLILKLFKFIIYSYYNFLELKNCSNAKFV
jgi:hypothetical protein